MSERATCTCAACPAHGGEREKRRTPISARRFAGRARFAGFLHDYFLGAARRGVTLVPSWAARLDVSQQALRQWANPLKHHAVVGAGDLEALEPADLLALLEAWADDVRGRLAPVAPMADPRLVVVALMERAGEVAGEVRAAVCERSRSGSAIDADEWVSIETALTRLETTVREARLAARAAQGGR